MPAVGFSLWYQGYEGDDPVAAALRITPLAVAGFGLLGLATGAFQTVNSTMIIAMRPVSRAGTVNGIRATAQQTAVSLGTFHGMPRTEISTEPLCDRV